MKHATYFVVFKAGYEVEAKDTADAVYLAQRELAYEILMDGIERFVIDVDGNAYTMNGVMIKNEDEKGDRRTDRNSQGSDSQRDCT